MGKLLSDDEVFGTGAAPALMSDEEVFGGAVANESEPPKRGFIGSMASLAKDGIDSAITSARLSGDVATGNFDENAPKLIAGSLNVDQSGKPQEFKEVAESFAPAQQAKVAAGDWSEPLDNVGAVGQMLWNVGKQAVTNPKGLAYLTASQIANMAPSIAGMMAGAKGGAALGAVAAPVTGGASIPVGALVGGLAGGFSGEWPMEAGSEFIGIIGKELSTRNLAPNEQNVAALLADKGFMETAVSQARTKATVTSGIDSAMTLGAGRLVGAPGRAAERAARVELGAAATGAEIAKRAGEIVASRSMLQKTGNVSRAVGLDVAGGGLSEAGGQVAAYGEADYADVGMEMLGELGGAGIELPSAAWAAGKGIVRPAPTPDAKQPPPPARPGSLTSAANIAAQQGITPTPVPTEAIDAAELLGTPDDTAPPLAEAAQAPLAEPASMSILDEVTNGATSRPISTTLDTGSATGASDNTAGSDTNGVLQHDAATGAGRLGMPGTAVEDNGAGGVQSNGSNQPRHVGHPSEVVLPDNSALPAQWEVVDADQVTATLKEGKNQPRDRSRAAANAQVQGIANMPDYRRLADSPVMDVGAPTLSQDGAIVGGNGRFEGVSRAYDQGTAAEYRAHLEADAAAKGIDPATFSGMNKPVLVRRITQPFDTRALAVASNSGGSLQYSALEQAKIDGERMNSLGDIEVNDTGDVVMSGGNMANVRRALTGYNAAEMGSMTDKDGLLSQEGIRRIKNALLYKAYGNSSVLSRLVESADPDLKSVMGALVRSAGSVASVRADMKDGNKPADADIAEDLLSGVELLSKIKAQGSSVEQYMAQDAMFGKEYTKEAAAITRYLSDNIRSQKRMAEYIKSYYDGIANEDHLTGSMFETAPASKKERLDHAARQAAAGSATEQRPTERGRETTTPVVHAQDQHQSENAQRATVRDGAVQQDTGVTGDGTKAAPIKVEHHDHIKQAEQRVNTNPTDAQKKNGNYAMGHVVWNGLDITIENPQGSERSGTDANGKAWSVTMPASYGYLKRTEGADGDHIDVYLGKHLQSDKVFIIDQKHLGGGEFDEHKVMLGFPTLREAERIYKRGFSDGKGVERLGAITPISIGEFKEWIKTEDTTKPVAESLLTSYTQADIAKREQQDTTAEDQAAVDRAVEHSRNQPLSLSAQTQERSEGKTAQAGMFTPDGRATVAAEQSAKAKADADIQDALNDLGAIMRDLVGVQRIMPEDQQKLLPVLVRLFDAAFRKGYYDIREATRFVRNLLAESDATKAAAKFLPVSLMDQAAKEAAAKMPEGFFENQGLFNQAAPKQEAEHVQDRMTNADKKSDSRNFKLPALHEFVPADVLQRAHYLIVKTPKAKEPTISAEDRAAAEVALKPLIKKAEKAKPEFDRIVVEIAKDVGIGQMLADVKGVGRAAEKMVLEKGYSYRDLIGARQFDASKMRDLLRATVVVESYSDVDVVVAAIKARFAIEIDKKNGEERYKDRVANPTSEGYRDVMLNVVLKDGTIAEIQINIPAMLAAKDLGHDLHERARVLRNDDPLKAELDDAQKALYAPAYQASTRSTPHSLENSASVLGNKYPRVPISEPSETKSSLNGANTLPSGTTQSGSPLSVSQNFVPSGNLAPAIGNLSGNFISGSSKHTIAKNASEVHNADTGSGENTTQGAQHENRSAGAGSNEGKSATTAGAAQGKPKSGSVHPDFSGRHIVRNNHPVIADSDQARVQRPGQDAAGAGGDTQRGDTAGAGDRAGGAAGLPAGQPGTGAVGVVDGRAGRAVPAGRDIPAKTGGNYHFTEADLDYKGSWFTKAKQNVEAVELVKKLDKEGRKATRAEQAILAKFIGWGASEIRNNIFDTKLDAQLETLAKYDEAIASLGNKPYLTNSNYREYHPAFLVLQAKNPALSWYTAGNITKAMLDAAKPDKSVSDWGKLRDRLQAVMSDEDWKTAERSTQYAHYTGKEVVTEILRAADLLGFKGGSMLEPGAGIGVFPGLMNSAMANNSIYTGIEFDALTGAILQHLQPDERILVESFIDSALPDNFYDVAIGNPPFSDSKVLSDPRYKKHAFALHDYFFAKTMDKVKPGGLVMFVTSRHTMDKQGDKARQYLAERADLLGAIRLPQTAFQKNAGTEVVTDILFLRKKVPGETFEGHGWMGLEKIKIKGGDHLINEYFAKHPEMVLGEGALESGQFGKQYTVLPNKDVPTTELLAKAVDRLPRDVFRPAEESAAKAAQVRQLDFNPKAKKEGNYYVSDDGKLMQVENRLGVPADKVKGIDAPLVRSFVRLRDALNQTQYDQLNDGDWEASLKALQKEYKAFVRVHGNLLQNTVVERKAVVEDEDGNEVEDIISSRRFKLIPKLNDDPEYSKVLALETINDDTGEIKESDFLTKRTLDQRKESKISTPHDALLSSLNDLGRVDIPLIAQRIGLSEIETINSLGSAIYESPSNGWQMADEYLSGNVKAKLKEAEAAAKTDRGFARNVEALMNAQPSPVSPSDITTSLGMNWIPGEVYAQFLHEKTGVKANISYNEHTGNWNVSVISGNKTNRATVDWGTADRDAADIMEAGLTGRTIRITAKDPDTKATVFQPAATEAAIQKLKEMRQAFADWMWQDNERTEKLVTLYNDKFNTTVSRKFDGRHLTLPGTTTTISVFDHVKRGAWRIIQSGNTYLAHAVGSGKTWEMVISAMEQKRLGMISKPMMVVPNHMLQQFAQEWLQLYPSARLMVADEKQFHTDNRRRFIARVGMSDLDGVIITHSAFKLLDLDPEFKDKMMNEQLDYYRAALEEVQDAEGDTGDAKKSRSPKVRDIQNRIEKLEEKLKSAMSGEGKDKNVRFDEMGVDMLYVDEAHEYRKLEFSTVRQVKGISSTGSDRAFDLYMKTRWLEEKKPGRSLVLASGTPVTNTMAEMYSVQRFMQPKVLEEKGLQTFDAWASMFGEESTEIEADASGKYAPVTRFANIVNVPELTQMFREFADVLTSEHLAEMLGDKRPSVKYGARKLVITPQVDDYLDYKKELAARLEKSRKWKPSRDEPNNPDPVIRIIGDGRLAAIDMRFIDPSLPSDPASKLNVMADGVIKSYKKGADYTFKNKAGKEEETNGTTQMVFSDIGFGAGVAANRGFNARAWFEKRLRDAGIPPNQVVFMSDLKKSDAKQKAFKDMNSGRVRILVGSSKNMGTGVNAQQRLRALHHLDTPWYPADLEQREGRIVRQGNKNRNVRIFAYSTKGSYDTNMWQLLARKQRFIDQALSGDSSVRRLEDISETSQFQMATAMTAGDERAIRLAGLKSDIDRYQRLYRSHEETRMRLAQEIVRAKYAIEVAERKLPGAEKMAGKVQDLSGDKFAAKAGKTTYSKRKEWGEALLAKLKAYADTAKEGVEVVGEVSGMPIEIIGKIDRNNDGKVLGYYVRLEMKLGEDGAIIGRDPNDDAVGLSMRATNALAGVERKPEELRKTVLDAKAQISANESRTGAKFQFAQEMADKIKEAKELEAEMERDGKDHSNSELVQKAKAFAEKYHSEIDQRRKFTNEPYIMHPQGVVDILRTVPHTEEMLAAAWAHDTVEDTKVMLDDVRAELGDKVADLVEQLTKPYDISKMTPDAQTIKLADITHNALAAKDAPADFTRRYLPKKTAELELLKGGNQELWGKAKQAIEGDDVPLASVANKAQSDSYEVQPDTARNLPIDGATLVELRRAAAGIESAERGVTFTVSADGKAIVTGPARVKVPARFQRFANEHGLTLVVQRASAAGGFSNANTAMPTANREAGALYFGEMGTSHIDRTGRTRFSKAEQANPTPQTVESIKQATAKLRASWHGFKRVIIVQSVKEIPTELYLRALRAAKPIDQHSEGIYDPKTYTVYLVADNIASPERAVWVAIHEVVGHGGIRMLGSPVVDALIHAAKNGFVTKLAQAIATDRGEIFDARTHTDEAIAELAAATITGNVDAILERYGVKVPIGMRSNLLGMIRRVVDAVRQFIGRVTGKPIEEVSDGEVLGLIRQMKNAVEGKAQGYDTAGVSQGVMASRAPQEKQPSILRTAKAASMESDVSLIDKVVSAPFKLVGWNRIVEPAIDLLMERAGEFVPEKVKAGLVSDYGLGADYIDRKAEMKAAEAALNRKSAGLSEMLAGLTRAESRIAYQWMQVKPDAATEKALLEQLPADSRDTLATLKKLISDMGKEAVRLGQMSREAYERNNMSYLHRTYAKHVLDKEGVIGKMLRARALRIKGNQYKGRGIFDEVKMDAIGGDREFWRKLQQGRADNSLVGEKVIRFERRDASTEAMDALPGMTSKPMGRLHEVIYWPANQAVPAKFGDWVNAGTFEVRGTKGDKLVVWRDFTPEERERMGELDEVRYAVAQTLQMMTHDIEVGRFFEWTGKTYGKVKPDGREVVASESMLHSYGKDEWVQVPAALIPGTQTRKYGALAGLYIPGAVWNDIRQTAGAWIEPFGHTHEKVLQFWKKSKTAWSPAVHANNVMANFVIADWHDLRASDLAEALKVWALNKKDGYREIYQRFEDSGALGGMFLSNEALRDEIAKQLESMKAELTGELEAKDEMTRMAKVMHLVTMAGMVPVKGAKAYTSNMEDAYQFEDAIFRLAAFTKAIRYGKSDIEAGRIARHSFLNYDINAPWIQAARHTALPFISFFYRALPMAVNTAKAKPWKILKLLAFWQMVNAIGYAMSGGDEDDERDLLPKEKQGGVWGVVPKMVRMPWNHDDDAPYFLDIRRWVPVGDVADMEMGSGMLPPWATPGGVIPLLAEVLLMNKSIFTEKEIVQDTDTAGEALEKRMDHLFKGFMPNVPLPNPLNLQTPMGEINPLGLSQGSGQSYAWSGIERSALKREGQIGEVRNTTAAIISAFGVKASAYPAGNMQAAKQIEMRKNVEEIKDAIKKIQRNYGNLEEPTEAENARFERDIERQRGKLEEAQLER